MRTEIKTVQKLELIPVNDELLEPCTVPPLPTLVTKEGVLVDMERIPAYLIALFGDVELCNIQLEKIRWLYDQQEAAGASGRMKIQ